MSGKPIATLEETSVMAVVVSLYNDREIRHWSKFIPPDVATAEWYDLINSKISILSLPTLLHNRILAVARHVCLFMVQLHAVHDKISSMFGSCHCLNGILESSFFLKLDGLFDEKKAVEKLVFDKRIDVVFRFTLACEFSVLIKVVDLWRQLEPRLQWNFRLEKRIRKNFCYVHFLDPDFLLDTPFLIALWLRPPPKTELTNLLLRLT